MTVSTIRPDSTSLNEGVVTGAATAHAALSDDSDSSYVTLDASEEAEGGLGDFTLPAGAVMKSLTARARTARVSDDSVMFATWFAGGVTVQAALSVTWSSPTTVSGVPKNAPEVTEADVDAGTWVLIVNINKGTVHVYEFYADVTYVVQPVVSADAPTGTVGDTNRPAVEWANTLDSDGGAQTRFEVKVFTDAQYGAGGFDPDTSTPTDESGVVSSSAASWQVGDILPDDTYRAYVRVAQTVNGELHWSDWDFAQFTIDVDLPAAPTVTVTPQDADGRNQVVANDNAGTATTDALEFQWSLDGVEWAPLRLTPSDEDAGVVLGTDATVWDYEAPNGVEVTYRVRALHDYSGVWAASAWAEATGTRSSGQAWLKHPLRPDLNLAVEIHSFGPRQRAARQGVFQPLGRSDVIVVSDKRGPLTGALVLRVDTQADQEALEELLDELATLLIQGGAGDRVPIPLYVRFADQTSAPLVDKAWVEPTVETLPWTRVARPDGDIVAWP